MTYCAGDYYEEVEKRSFFDRSYIVLRPMNFHTRIRFFEASIVRKPDGKILARLEKSGLMTVYPEYYWDGPSGPTIDTHAFILGSCPHDVFYQMLRENLLINHFKYLDCLPCMYADFKDLRNFADLTMKDINLKFGMSRFRAYYTYKSVQLFGEKHAMPEILKDAFI
jgi:hypothetical protein